MLSVTMAPLLHRSRAQPLFASLVRPVHDIIRGVRSWGRWAGAGIRDHRDRRCALSPVECK